MKLSTAVSVVILVVGTVITSAAQDKAAVQAEKAGPFKPGGPIVFTVKLNEPLPKGARFDLRISPVSVDQQIPLGSGEPVDGSDRIFRVSSKLPENALPGDWHISVIWLFLPGSGWTTSSLAPNDLRFQVEGKPYPVPTKAEVNVSR
jgi:hypothetical protein